MDSASRLPIKDKPLRHAGQALEEERRALWEDKLEPYAIGSLMVVLLAALEWWRWFSHMQPSPALFSVVAAASVGIVAWKIWRIKPG